MKKIKEEYEEILSGEKKKVTSKYLPGNLSVCPQSFIWVKQEGREWKLKEGYWVKKLPMKYRGGETLLMLKKLNLTLNYIQSHYGVMSSLLFLFRSMTSFHVSTVLLKRIPETWPQMWTRYWSNFKLSDSTWIINHFQVESVPKWILT